jgi:hypothetical protein
MRCCAVRSVTYSNPVEQAQGECGSLYEFAPHFSCIM